MLTLIFTNHQQEKKNNTLYSSKHFLYATDFALYPSPFILKKNLDERKYTTFWVISEKHIRAIFFDRLFALLEAGCCMANKKTGKKGQ